eukprot:Opistho-2@10970
MHNVVLRNKADDATIPRECVFLAIDANSATRLAHGPKQAAHQCSFSSTRGAHDSRNPTALEAPGNPLHYGLPDSALVAHVKPTPLPGCREINAERVKLNVERHFAVLEYCLWRDTSAFAVDRGCYFARPHQQAGLFRLGGGWRDIGIVSVCRCHSHHNHGADFYAASALQLLLILGGIYSPASEFGASEELITDDHCEYNDERRNEPRKRNVNFGFGRAHIESGTLDGVRHCRRAEIALWARNRVVVRLWAVISGGTNCNGAHVTLDNGAVVSRATVIECAEVTDERLSLVIASFLAPDSGQRGPFALSWQQLHRVTVCAVGQGGRVRVPVHRRSKWACWSAHDVVERHVPCGRDGRVDTGSGADPICALAKRLVWCSLA